MPDNAKLGKSLAAGAIVLAVTLAGLAHISADTLASSKPELMARLAPWHARPHARLAELALAGDPQIAVATAEAGRALQRDATDIVAIRSAAMSAGLAGNDKRTSQLIDLGLEVTRRDLPTSYIAIERASASNDVRETLRRYDQALRTNRSSWDQLMPILANAAGDPAIVKELAPVLARQPQWLYPFYRIWAEKSPNLDAMTDLSQRLDANHASIDRDTRVGLIGRLIAARRWDLLRGEAARALPGCAPDRCVDTAFASTGNLIPLDWTLGSGDNVVILGPGERTGTKTLTFQVSAGEDRLIARRLQLLAPGTYRLGIRFDATGGQSEATARVTCADISGRDLRRRIQPRGSASLVSFEVPADCPAQWIDIVPAGPETDSASGRVVGVDLARAAGEALPPQQSDTRPAA